MGSGVGWMREGRLLGWGRRCQSGEHDEEAQRRGKAPVKVVHVGMRNSIWTKDCSCFVLEILEERDHTPKGNESHLEMTYAHYAKKNFLSRPALSHQSFIEYMIFIARGGI